MTDGRDSAAPPDWAADWTEIWQSEWRALAADRELAETAAAAAARWTEGLATAAAFGALFVPAPDGAPGRPWPRTTAGPTPALAASDAVDADAADRRIAELGERVAELERRLAGLAPSR